MDFVSFPLSLSLFSRCFVCVCVEYTFETRMFDYLLYSQPPSRPYKWQVWLQPAQDLFAPTIPPLCRHKVKGPTSHVPHRSKSCPYKMRGFLPNTYNRGWHCCSIFLSFSQAYNLRLWTVQNSSGFWHPSMVPSKKNADAHTHRTKFQVGFLLPFGFTTKWVPWICYIQTVLDVSKCSTPFKANFLSTKWVLYNGWKQQPKTILINKKGIQPKTRPIFGTHFVENQPWVAGPEPAFCREIFQATPFCRWSWVIL